jgi:glycosyltransferase involved in cell wall biosynthesis
MHILLIHQYFLGESDGGGTRFNEMTRFWTEAGHKVSVIAGMVHYTTGKKSPQYKGKYIVKEKNENGITVFRCHVSEAYNSNFLGRFWAYLSFVFSSSLCGLFFAHERYSVVIATSPPLPIALTGIILSKLKRIPLVFEVRDLWPESAIDAGVLTNPAIIKASYFLESSAYNNATVINTLTPAFQRKLIDVKHIQPNKIVMIPNAADFSLVDTIMPTFDISEFRKANNLNNHFVITYVGAHGVANALGQLIEAAELLKDTTALFLLIGDGMEKQKLKKEVLQRKINNIRFIDQIPKKEVLKFIIASDAGASVLKNVPTFKTVYSNKTFDYMSCKKPILMGIDGVSRELVEEAQCGLFFEPENAHAFNEKARFYINNPNIAIQHGINGYKYARIHFDRKVLADKYLDILLNCTRK